MNGGVCYVWVSTIIKYCALLLFVLYLAFWLPFFIMRLPTLLIQGLLSCASVNFEKRAAWLQECTPTFPYTQYNTHRVAWQLCRSLYLARVHAGPCGPLPDSCTGRRLLLSKEALAFLRFSLSHVLLRSLSLLFFLYAFSNFSPPARLYVHTVVSLGPFAHV